MTEQENLEAFILKEDAKLNRLAGWNANNIKDYFTKLIDFGEVEVGYRCSCGKTDVTMKTYGSWLKVIKKILEKLLRS